MRYIKQLDSLRAIAVIFVIISHWVPPTNFINRIPNGAIGVDIFFVLSGFLITRILFVHKIHSLENGTSIYTLVKNFYVRRTLRIFPVYYLTIFATLAFSGTIGIDLSSSFVYYATYTSNFYFFFSKTWGGMFSHLWSLAVEEQFYLIWPWIILFVNKKYYLKIISCFILIGIVSQYLLSKNSMGHLLTFTCFDAFGLGALLSWQLTFAPEKIKKFYIVFSVLAFIAFVFFFIGALQHRWDIIPIRTLVALMTVWIITLIVIKQESKNFYFKFIFNNRVLIFLGKISYGIYLFHNIIPSTLNSKIINKYINPLLPDILYKKHWGQLYLMENLILLILISWLSFVLFEKRFLALKKYF